MLLAKKNERDPRLAILALALLAVAASSALASASDAPGAPAQVVDYEPPMRTESYRVTEFGKSPSSKDDRVYEKRFRVIERTGNCCENYITIGPDGTLYDIGGRYINFTKDDGKTWKSVQPVEPLINGEGAMTMAPGGDIVGIEWDPYSGDHLLAYKYDAAAEQWQYLESPLHTPFYDRPWLTLVPGPHEIAGLGEVPYVTMVDGFPHRGPYLYSTDGLTYLQTTNPFIDQRRGEVQKGWIKTKKDPDLDWILPNSQSPITPLGGGRALAQPGPFAQEWSMFDPKTQTWSAWELPEGGLDGKLLVDSKGRIHNLLGTGRNFTYRISTDGGRTWSSTPIDAPEGGAASGYQFDFRVNAKVGIAAVAMHTDRAEGDDDLLYKLDISTNRARIVSLYEIGKGDTDAASGVGQDIRFDFETVAIFPDGRLAVSFLDSTTGPIYSLTELIGDRLGPALAIEL